MKLHEVPRGTKIHIVGDEDKNIITFHNLDCLYSYCTTEDGSVIHLSRFQEVEIVNVSDDKNSDK